MSERPVPRPLPFPFRLGNLGIRIALTGLRVHVHLEGVENIPDDLPGVILASNHLSIADPPLLSLVIARLTGRRVRYMAKAEALEAPIMGPVLRAYGGFGVRRGSADREAYRMARAVLDAGDWLGLAPEGTRSRTGALGDPKAGVALLALRSGAPILPVGLAGTERLWPVGARLPRFGTDVTVRFGPLYRPAATPAADDRRAALEASSDELMRRIAALLPPAYRGRFG
ncbi:MAG: lysophospholipid acyltransferase family protein [Candidatus Limnocylindrales bacterium]